MSLALSDAYFPLGTGPEVQPKIDGDVLFDAVEFMPGPLADKLIGIFRQERRPLLVLRDPVSVRIVGRTIYQEGLIIPLGNVAAIGIEGTVDFDQNLNLVASFAMAPPRKEIPVLSEILENTQLQVPITGTLKNPRLDGDAIAERFKNMGVEHAGHRHRRRRQRPGTDHSRWAGSRTESTAPRLLPAVHPSRCAREPPAPPKPGGRATATSLEILASEPIPALPLCLSLDNPDDQLDQPPGRPGQLTPQQRQLLREERKARRLESVPNEGSAVACLPRETPHRSRERN